MFEKHFSNIICILRIKMVLIIYLIEYLIYFIIKSFIIFVTLLAVLYYGVVLIKRVLYRGVVSSGGKAVLVTGCDSAFGHLLVQRLCQMGFRVYATVQSIGSEATEQLKSDPEFGQKVNIWEMDVTNDSQVNEVYERIRQDLENSGHVLWAVVNNGGTMRASLLEWASLDIYRQVFEDNLFGTLRVTKLFLPLIKACKGRVVNMTSVEGRVALKPLGITCMSKYSLVAFTDVLRREMKKFGVNVALIEHDPFPDYVNEPGQLTKQIDSIWMECSDEMKKFYGSNAKECQLIVWKMDVTNDSEVNEVFERVKRDLQNSDHVLWAVVNNAGINCSCPLEWSTMDTYYKQLEVNLFGVVRITRTFMPLIRLAKGRLTNIVSILGRFSIEVAGIYCMGKHALVAFSDVLRREVRQFNVKVSTIEPAFFRTDIVNTDIWNKQLEQNWNQSTDEVKKSYVNYEYQQKMATNLDKMISVSDNIDAVIDDIIDSIINTRPKTSYRPSVGILSKIQMFIALYFPTEVFDIMCKLQEKLVIR